MSTRNSPLDIMRLLGIESRYGLEFTHFHPLGGFFSDADIYAAIDARLSKMRAFNETGAYVFELPFEKLSKLTDQEIRDLSDKLSKLFAPLANISGNSFENAFKVVLSNSQELIRGISTSDFSWHFEPK